MLFCSGGRAFAQKFCPEAGLLTTSKKFPGGVPGGCWRLELTDASGKPRILYGVRSIVFFWGGGGEKWCIEGVTVKDV